MSHETKTTAYIIVAFRYDERHSVMYEKRFNPDEIAKLTYEALRDDKADVISIRRVYEKCPIPT